jgi:nitrate/nitrite-specific signal transduction histidine kinase
MLEGAVGEVAFPHQLKHKLAMVFGALVSLVLIVGGISLYVAHSVFVNALEVKKESERIDLVDRLHYTAHHIIEALTMSALQVRRLAEDQRKAYFAEIRNVLRRYEAETGKDTEMIAAMWREIRTVEDASKVLVGQSNPRAGAPNRRGLEVLAESAGKIQTIAHALSAIHRAKMEEMIKESTWKMGVAQGLYGGFVLLGILLVLGSSVFVARGITQPLRSLADGAAEVAHGNLDKQVPVTSKDEIGQLSHAFNVMIERIKENEERLQGLVMVEERERIAQEFHDTLAQDLVLLQMKLNMLEMDLPRESSLILEKLKNIRIIANDAYEDVRQAIFGLRTMVSKGLGLVPTLTEYLHEFSERREIAVDLKVHNPELIRLSTRAEIQLIHIIHEALNNVFKHSQAKTGAVSLECDGKSVKATIEDKGKGFVLAGARDKFHLGLQTMKERADGVGGKLTVESTAGVGTKVYVVLPLSGDADEADSSTVG